MLEKPRRFPWLYLKPGVHSGDSDCAPQMTCPEFARRISETLLRPATYHIARRIEFAYGTTYRQTLKTISQRSPGVAGGLAPNSPGNVWAARSERGRKIHIDAHPRHPAGSR